MLSPSLAWEHAGEGVLLLRIIPDSIQDLFYLHAPAGPAEEHGFRHRRTRGQGRHGPAQQAQRGGGGHVQGVGAVEVIGIATDYCVLASALDARKAGRRVRVLTELVAGVAPVSSAAALETMASAGVILS